jgi:uncharacterized protein
LFEPVPVRALGLAAFALLAACSRPEKPTKFLAVFPLTDTYADGTPDFLRLDSDADRKAFRRWFTFLAESQFYRPPGRTAREVVDCAALLRYAYRETLRQHTGEWATSLELDVVPSDPPVTKYAYPLTPVGASLFRVRPGAFRMEDLNGGAFAQFADAQTLQRYNTHFVSRDTREARPGDLLFYRQLSHTLPFHAMIYLGASTVEPGREQFVIYHTGPLAGGPGEIRRPALAELAKHPEPRWRPLAGNGNFLGVYRWNILRTAE